jgi:hypothetical protein
MAESSTATLSSPPVPPVSPSNRGWVRGMVSVLAWLVLAGGLATVAAAIHLVVTRYMRVPYWDMWSEVNFWAHPDKSLLYWLWAQHNEHRILIPKLILMLDYRVFRGRDIFVLVLILGVQLAVVTMMVWSLRAWGGVRGPVLRTLSGAGLLCGFSTSQWANFDTGFQITFVLVNLFVVLAVIFLLLSQQSREKHLPGEWSRVALAALMGTAATYSAANGVLIWPVLIVVAIVQRSRRAIITFLSASGIIVVASYLHHYTSPGGHANPLVSIRHPFIILAYIAKYLGSPLDWGHATLASAFGAAGLATAVVILGIILFVSKRGPVLLLFGSLLLFTIGSAGLTALGRLSFGTDQALSSRYETFALLFWFALGALSLRFVARRSVAAVVGLQTLLLLAMAIAATRWGYPLKAAKDRALNTNTASLALVTGVYDPTGLTMLFPVPSFPWRDIPYLKQHRVSVFATRLASDLNQPLAMAYHLRSEPCWGAVDRVTGIATNGQEGLRVVGWAWDPIRRRQVGQIIFVAEGNIVGYAEPGYARPDVKKRVWSRSAADAGWMGYVEPLPSAPTISLYATLGWRGDQVCRVDHLPSPASLPVQFSAKGVIQ